MVNYKLLCYEKQVTLWDVHSLFVGYHPMSFIWVCLDFIAHICKHQFSLHLKYQNKQTNNKHTHTKKKNNNNNNNKHCTSALRGYSKEPMCYATGNPPSWIITHGSQIINLHLQPAFTSPKFLFNGNRLHKMNADWMTWKLALQSAFVFPTWKELWVWLYDVTLT